MSRIFKFRAWDKVGVFCPGIPEKHHKPRMLYDVQNTYDYCESDKTSGERSFGELLQSDQYVVMQYTGIKDSKEVEIYEGDVVKHPERNNAVIYKVEWREDYARFTLSASLYNDEEFEDIEEFEVISNIYQSPELLKEDRNA